MGKLDHTLRLSLILGICSALACSSSPKNAVSTSETKTSMEPTFSAVEPPASSRATSLSREAAMIRSKQLTHVSYRLWFGLDDTNTRFQGRTIINFSLKTKAKEHGKKIMVDLEEATVHSVKVNGTSLTDLNTPERFDGHHLYFSINELLPTSNRIEISYTHPYNTDGNGLHRFKDPVDGRVYLYSNFEPYHAHFMFPCFDQPDLKASYELTVEVPEEWQVISNTLQKEITTVDGRKSWQFPPSPVFSTYVFALHAGPYAVWKGDADGIPIRLFSRKSVSKYVDHDEWLNVTRKGLDFYGTLFGFPYPFVKYDQVIVPDFNAGAMENVGAVTFSERYVYRTRVTNDRRRGRANTILHEMAHMWFGDLVTMRWWNGLWLNESFATFMASWAVDQATSFPGSWQSFFSGSKQWAYWEDQLVTTHPIELPVPDTERAGSNFDGITYGKGAATLKQLSFYLSEDDFKEGLQRYFQKYAYRNTTLGEFFKMLGEASSADLSQWQKAWLHTTGVNTVQADWACEVDEETKKSKISKFKLIQSGSILRPHRTQVALYHFPKPNSRKGALSEGKTFDVTYTQGETQVPEAVGKPCPDFVFPNQNDYDYVKVELDPVSLKTITHHLANLTDTLTRQMLWHSLWEMVTNGKLRPQDYADIVLSQSETEKDTLVLSKILRTLVDPVANRESVLKFLKGDLRNRYQTEIESYFRKHLQLAPGGSDQQLVWYQAFLDAASSPKAVHYLASLLKGDQKLRGFTVDQEHRWEIIQALARNNEKGIQDRIAEELKKDPTDMGQKAAIAAEAMIPNPETKAKWLTQAIQNSDTKTGALPIAKLREAMGNYQLLGQEEFTQKTVDAFFNTLSKFSSQNGTSNIADDEFSKSFSKTMFPSLCEASIVQRTTEFLDQHQDLPASVIKHLKIGRQEEERCITARKKSEQES